MGTDHYQSLHRLLYWLPEAEKNLWCKMSHQTVIDAKLSIIKPQCFNSIDLQLKVSCRFWLQKFWNLYLVKQLMFPAIICMVYPLSFYVIISFGNIQLFKGRCYYCWVEFVSFKWVVSKLAIPVRVLFCTLSSKLYNPCKNFLPYV